jgi:6-phosphogluconolactonase (cycloisomerase 2 family)/methionine-rich copper-binding protein CopC
MPQNHLTFVEFLKDNIAPVQGLDNAQGVVLSPDGKYVYVTGLTDDRVAVFSRDASTGKLTFVESLHDSGGNNGLNGASGITMSSDGKFVYIAAAVDKSIAVFSRNAETGKLTYVEAIVDTLNLDEASGVTVSPDDKFVYVASNRSDTVSVFSRDSSNGKLTLVETLKNGENGVTGLDFASNIVISSDGTTAYVTGNNSKAITFFLRDTSTGKLTWTASYVNNVNNVKGLDGAAGVVMSSDDKFIYVAARNSDAITVFSRESNGKLTFVETLTNTTPGISGLDQASRVALSPDGNYVYVTALTSDAIAVFSRDSTTGKLTFVESLKDTDTGIDGLDGARGITVSADGKFIYVTGSEDDAIAVFTTAPPPDVTAPTVDLYTPDPNGTGVAPTSNLEIEFNEAVKKGTGNIVIKDSNGNVVETIDVTSSNVTINDITVTIDPTKTLQKGATYYVEIDATAITDLAGNAFAGITGSSTWSFSTSEPDAIAPTVVEFKPGTDEINVSVASNLVIIFDEEIQKGTGKIFIKKEDGTIAEEIDVTSSNVTIDNNRYAVTIDPTKELEENVVYYVEIEQGAIKDLDGNDYLGISDTTEWTFATPDNTAPTATLSPTDNATNVVINSNLVLTFSEKVLPGTGNIVIRRKSDGETVEFFDAASLSLTDDDKKVVLELTTLLDTSTEYYIEIDKGAFTDRAGNEFVGFSGPNDWNFTTSANGDITAPTVDIIDVSPDPRTTGVDSITIQFDEIVSGFDISDLQLTQDGNVVALSAENLTTQDNQTWVLSGLTQLTSAVGTYSLTLSETNSGIIDEAGNALSFGAFEDWVVEDPNSGGNEDTTPPTVDIIDVSPDPRTTGVNSIIIQFNEAIQGLDIADFQLTLNSAPLALTDNNLDLFTQDNKTWTFSGLGNLTSAVGTYVLSLNGVDSGISDNAGNLLSSNATESWIVKDPNSGGGGTDPGGGGTNPGGGGTNPGGGGTNPGGGGTNPGGGGTNPGGTNPGGTNPGGTNPGGTNPGGTDQVLTFATAPAPINFKLGKPGIIRGGTNKVDKLIGSKLRDVLNAKGGNDRINAKHGNDRIKAGAGNDVVKAGKGDDQAAGDAGNDRLIGDAGNDVLLGGAGDDQIKGGSGKDMLVYGGLTDGTDRFTDFNVAEDLLDLRGLFGQAQFGGVSLTARFKQFIRLEQVGSDTAIKVDVDGNGTGTAFQTIITLSNVAVGSVQSTNFLLS